MISKIRFPALAVRLAAGPMAILLASDPAAAGQVRSSMSVSVTVMPSCYTNSDSGRGARTACPDATSVTATTAPRPEAGPLGAGAADLGAAARNGAATAQPAPIRYHTITY